MSWADWLLIVGLIITINALMLTLFVLMLVRLLRAQMGPLFSLSGSAGVSTRKVSGATAS